MIILFSIVTSLIALGIAGFWALNFKKAELKNDKVREISGFIRTSAKAYLAREYRAIFFAAAGICIVLLVLLGWKVALGFIVGAAASALAGYIGMIVSVHANGATAEAAEHSEASAFSVAFRSGTVTGLMGLLLFYRRLKSSYRAWIWRKLALDICANWGGYIHKSRGRRR